MDLSVLYLLLFVGSSAYAMGRLDREPRTKPPASYPGSPIADGARVLAAADRRRRAAERVTEPVG